MSACVAQLAQKPSTPKANNNIPRNLFRKDSLPILSTSRSESPRTRAFAHAIHTRVKKFQSTSNVYELHPNAVLSGDLIQISGIPQEICRSIQRLVLRGDLDWAKHLKVSIDLGHPSKKKLATFASIVQREMWSQGTSDSFYPPDVRHREHFITATGSTMIPLERNGSIIGIRQPDAGLNLHKAACPFLIIDVACRESEEHIIQKAKEYIRCSRGRIVYVIMVSVAILTKIDSVNPHTEPQPHDSPIAEESPPLSPLTSLGSTPTSPSVINQRFGIVHPGDSQQNPSMISLAPRTLPDKDSRQSTEPLAYNPQHTVHVWVYKQSLVPISNPGDVQGVKIAARPIIERAELYPKIPSYNDLCFDILWSEISCKPSGQAERKFTVHLDKLHDLAAEIFRVGESYGLAGFDDAISETQTTSGASCSIVDHSDSSREADAT